MTPGEVLLDVLQRAKVTPNAAALAMGIPSNRLIAIIHGQRAITADTAMRLGFYLGTSADVWMNLQKNYELAKAKEEHAERIEQTVRPLSRTIRI